MEFKIALIRGDGIGPEIVDSAVRVLKKIEERSDASFEFNTLLAGGAAIDETGAPLPKETIEGCLGSDSVLLGAVGGDKWNDMPSELRPEKALLGIRKEMELFTNLRPARIYKPLISACTLRRDIVDTGFDMVIVRELTGGIYFGERGRNDIEGGVEAFDVEKYNTFEIERIARVAFETAMKRRKNVVSVDKANVLESSRLWRETMHKVAEEYPEVELSDMYVDNAAMQLIRDPSRFDVLVTSNMFGDILSDEASQITGSIGLLPSASLGKTTRGMYEPIHGSAPDIAGQGKANPIATILSAAMMLRYSFALDAEADIIENAVEGVLTEGHRTADIADGTEDRILSTGEMTDMIIEKC